MLQTNLFHTQTTIKLGMKIFFITLNSLPILFLPRGPLESYWCIANEFNEYFTNVAEGITKNIPRTQKSPLSYLRNSNSNFFSISPCTTEDASKVIQSLKKW